LLRACCPIVPRPLIVYKYHASLTVRWSPVARRPPFRGIPPPPPSLRATRSTRVPRAVQRAPRAALRADQRRAERAERSYETRAQASRPDEVKSAAPPRAPPARRRPRAASSSRARPTFASVGKCPALDVRPLAAGASRVTAAPWLAGSGGAGLELEARRWQTCRPGDRARRLEVPGTGKSIGQNARNRSGSTIGRVSIPL